MVWGGSDIWCTHTHSGGLSFALLCSQVPGAHMHCCTQTDGHIIHLILPVPASGCLSKQTEQEKLWIFIIHLFPSLNLQFMRPRSGQHPSQYVDTPVCTDRFKGWAGLGNHILPAIYRKPEMGKYKILGLGRHFHLCLLTVCAPCPGHQRCSGQWLWCWAWGSGRGIEKPSRPWCVSTVPAFASKPLTPRAKKDSFYFVLP